MPGLNDIKKATLSNQPSRARRDCSGSSRIVVSPAPSAPVARHIERVESGFRELSATTPIRSPKSVPDTVSRSREFQVHIHPRARVKNEREARKFWVEVARGGEEFAENAPSTVLDAWLKAMVEKRGAK